MLTLWTRVSAAWSSVPPTSELEGERGLVYVAGLFVVLVAVEPEAVCHVVGGVVTGIAVVCTYALANYAASSPTLHPLALLGGPLGYPNALGVLAAIGIVLGVGLATRARSPSLRLLLIPAFVPMLAGADPDPESECRDAAVQLGPRRHNRPRQPRVTAVHAERHGRPDPAGAPCVGPRHACPPWCPHLRAAASACPRDSSSSTPAGGSSAAPRRQRASTCGASRGRKARYTVLLRDRWRDSFPVTAR